PLSDTVARHVRPAAGNVRPLPDRPVRPAGLEHVGASRLPGEPADGPRLRPRHAGFLRPVRRPALPGSSLPGSARHGAVSALPGPAVRGPTLRRFTAA